MNAERRKRIEKVRADLSNLKAEIEAIAQDERDYADNMPENMQSGDRHDRAEEAADALDEAASNCDDVDTSLETAVG